MCGASTKVPAWAFCSPLCTSQRATDSRKDDQTPALDAVISGCGSHDIFTDSALAMFHLQLSLPMLPDPPLLSINLNKGLHRAKGPDTEERTLLGIPVRRMLNTNSVMRSKHRGLLRMANQQNTDLSPAQASW